jgi:L-threonylcarbamoyladenylate synthase
VINWDNHAKINRAAAVLQDAGVVAYPTEAVWGLGCDPWSEQAVSRILQLKGRSEGKGLILIAHHSHYFAPFLHGLDADQLVSFNRTYDKPITWLVPDNGVAPDWIVGQHTTLALRVTAHPVASALCRAFGGPLVSTSANPQGLPEATTGLKVKSYFGSSLDYQTPGSIGNARAKPSEIRNLLTDEVVRSG